MLTVSHLLRNKGHDVWSISPDATVYDALKLLADKDIGALLVIEHGQLTGIISERDYARKVILQGKSSPDTPVRDIMTRKVYYVTVERTIEECMALMTEKRIRHLPVLEDGHITGVVSIGDIVKSIIADQQFMLEQLESYVMYSPPGPPIREAPAARARHNAI